MIVDTIVGGVLEPVWAKAMAGALSHTANRRPTERQERQRIMSLTPVRGHIIATGYLSGRAGKFLTEGDYLMERLTRSVVIAVASSVLSTLGSPAEAQPKPPANSREMLLVHWNDIGGKVVKLAEEFPEDKYNFKPVDGVRTFADQLRHVAFWNIYLDQDRSRGKGRHGAERDFEDRVRHEGDDRGGAQTVGCRCRSRAEEAAGHAVAESG